MALPVSRILMTDGINVQCAEILRSQGLHVTVAPKMSKDELIKQLEVGRVGTRRYDDRAVSRRQPGVLRCVIRIFGQLNR